ncbi:hypothetical protein [Erwinia sp. S38]|uniref:phage tail assembly protein T n=1 Tax=Erwinia sp. S38 TaxID=2769338 RepID=UPI001F17A02B|nr:hypothetical protein [Erwinia sp. S38]
MRTEISAAVIASTLANINRKKDASPFTVSDFSPHLQGSQPISLEDAMKTWM